VNSRRTDTYDVCIIGTGFGGSVSALRLAEKGYSVVVCEAGERFEASTYPRTSWNLKRFLWAPAIGLRGIQRIDLLRDVLVLSGAGVGGGSLVYANTLYEPLPRFYDDPQWAAIADWRAELGPHYDTARRMLGATQSPTDTPADDTMRLVATDMGAADTFHATTVGVFFGTGPGELSPDPGFGGAGPDRSGCLECGECMTGCRHGAKNTLDRNYLYLAEQLGVEVRANCAVVDLEATSTHRWTVRTARPGFSRRNHRATIEASHVIFAAGSLGTQRLLHRMRATGQLDKLSPRLGELTRTNSEAIVGATAPTSESTNIDYTRGVAITSSFHPSDDTHIEPVRYGRGSNSMGLLATVLVDGGGRVPRQLRFISQVLRHPRSFLRSLSVRRWSERSVILLVMQSRDNSLTTVLKSRMFGRRTRLTTEHVRRRPTTCSRLRLHPGRTHRACQSGRTSLSSGRPPLVTP